MRPAVCLPTKNEAASIEKMIDGVAALGYDMFVCDEESSDGTIELAHKKGINVYQRDGQGKGFGVQKAIEIAMEQGYEILVLIDCDCSYPVESIPALLELIPEYDIVVGARSMQRIEFSHRLVNYLHTGLVNLLYSASLQDINAGMRAFKVVKFNGQIDAKGFDVEAQMTAVALKNGIRIMEVPIEYRKRKGRSKIRPHDTFVILWRIFIERFRKKSKGVKVNYRSCQ